jgi:hypothetical protein
VGFKAILENGDSIIVNNDINSGHFFINGERVTTDYIYTGNSCEAVSVWVFENVDDMLVAPISLNDTPSFTPYEIIIKNIGQTPVVNNAYYLYTSKIETYNFTLSNTPRGCKILTANGTNGFSQILPVTVLEVYSDCETFGGYGFKNHKYIKKVSLPECKIISSSSNTLEAATITEWEFGKLKQIVGGSSLGTGCPFRDVDTVYIPNTVENITGYVCGDNKTVKLECTKAISISHNWYAGTAPTNFTMARDWSASVNISLAARKWSKDKFIDLFENYLFDLSGVGEDGTIWAEKELTIPQTIYDILTEEEFAIAENKGWIIGGA